MTSSLDGTAAVATPNFVTVTLSPVTASAASGELSAAAVSKTLRVPITAATTVRELAKGAMMRYVVSLRRTARESDTAVRAVCRAGIVVTDVYLLLPPVDEDSAAVHADGESCSHGRVMYGRPPPARVVELFSSDCVAHVVQVMKETVYMSFRAADHAAAAANATSASARASVTESVVTAASAMPGGQPETLLPRSVMTTAGGEDTSSSLSLGVFPGCSIATAAPVRDLLFSAPSSTSTAVAAAAATVVKTSCEAGEDSASTPILVRQQHAARSDHSVEGSDDDSTSSSSSSSDVEAVQALEDIAHSIATLQQREGRRGRWGPDAHKHFAANYVSSPQKIMTGRYLYSGRAAPPPAVRLQPLNAVSATLSQGSRSASKSPRPSKEGRGVRRPGNGHTSPPPQETQPMSPPLPEHRPPSPPAYKRHRCDSLSRVCGKSGDASRGATVTLEDSTAHTAAPTQCFGRRTGTSDGVTGTATPAGAGERAVDVRRHSLLDDHGGDPLLRSLAVTPATACAAASPPVPCTVAKPVIAGPVARQLSFGDDGDVAPKQQQQHGEPSSTTLEPTCTVLSVTQC
ncbi:hypothetical protein NESM_000166800 [Novymonas esmeraldas]|uniref:GPI-anchored surface protein n=1 Tax=Novymonas esmeraldas TaxID=1808958 RepID=A0AAW0F468_9TRYP